MKNITLPLSILVGCCVLAGTFYISQFQKQESIEKQQQIEIINKNTEIQRQIQAEENEKSIAAFRKSEIEADLKKCLLNAANKSLTSLDDVDHTRALCDQYSIYSAAGQHCITLVKQQLEKTQSTYELDKNQCYQRYPVN